ncbi:MAG TPA: DUF6599 family protein [Pyrinomonadaceae bacterium]
MRFAFPPKFIVAALFVLLLLPRASASEVSTAGDYSKILPAQVGRFRVTGRDFFTADGQAKDAGFNSKDFNVLSLFRRHYTSAKGHGIIVVITRTGSESSAYSLLTKNSSQSLSEPRPRCDFGTICFGDNTGMSFVKGSTLVSLTRVDKFGGQTEEVITLANLIADSLYKGEGEIPSLVKHLPEWEKVQDKVFYAVSLNALKGAVPDSAVLDVVSFEGGTEAVTATYGQSRLVIVEYTTPQIATDSDARINARIKELQGSGQPVPSAYRRVGNYSVFVFNAPDDQTAKQLIDGVSYEQVVQWLGDNPRALERAQRMYTQTTAGIILAVIKASGLAVLLCLGIGGLFGTIIFRRRRSQQAATAAYSDAGGMIRLNIDDMTPQNDPARLLGRSDG